MRNPRRGRRRRRRKRESAGDSPSGQDGNHGLSTLVTLKMGKRRSICLDNAHQRGKSLWNSKQARKWKKKKEITERGRRERECVREREAEAQ